MTLTQRLCRLRSKHGWTLKEQREAIKQATGFDVAISYLSSLEREPDRSPTIEALVRIAAGYDMTVVELIAPVTFEAVAPKVRRVS